MYVGGSGFSWSSITNGVNGMDLNFSSHGLGTSSTSYRGYGFQLRCLSE
ncbi:hypothetical protein [uncultured Rikenella sp.]|nr:hypothetical protein [uncultured Rikenella sp.]